MVVMLVFSHNIHKGQYISSATQLNFRSLGRKFYLSGAIFRMNINIEIKILGILNH
jgi:hypothetical protein